jgi:hypothetical protein
MTFEDGLTNSPERRDYKGILVIFVVGSHSLGG